MNQMSYVKSTVVYGLRINNSINDNDRQPAESDVNLTIIRLKHSWLVWVGLQLHLFHVGLDPRGVCDDNVAAEK